MGNDALKQHFYDLQDMLYDEGKSAGRTNSEDSLKLHHSMDHRNMEGIKSALTTQKVVHRPGLTDSKAVTSSITPLPEKPTHSSYRQAHGSKEKRAGRASISSGTMAMTSFNDKKN